MTLDKDHLDQFESISPPMVNALTIPVAGLKGVIIYVCSSPFCRTSKANVLRVAKALRLEETNG